MASITINASAGGGWYGSVTTTEHDSPEACEAACQLLERLLAARAVRARPKRDNAPSVKPSAPSPLSDLRAEILARLANGPVPRKRLLTGLGQKGAQTLRAMLTERPCPVDMQKGSLDPLYWLDNEQSPGLGSEA